ncbi:MAG: hypothetical protein ACFUZC_16585 [Chthoniobacteraceae bacterium]
MPDPQKIEESVHIIKDAAAPLKSPNTALVAAAATSGCLLSETQPFLQTLEEDPVTHEVKRQTVWCLKDMDLEFLPAFTAEKISTAEFVRRFRDAEWRAQNPHHPIAYMAWFYENHQRLLDKIKHNRPLFMVRRGHRTAFIPQGCDAATREKILALL